jgi:hypothetical protein
MKKTIFQLFILAFFIQTAVAQKMEKHQFACTDYTQGMVFIISSEGKPVWQYPAENCNDLWILPNGNLLFNTGKGVKEVTRDICLSAIS